MKKIRSNNIDLIVGYYRFLYLGEFLEDVIKEHDISEFAKDIKIKTGSSSNFTLKGDTIAKILNSIYKNSEKTNIFGYFTQLSAFKGIFGGIRELIENELPFKKFLVKHLGKEKFVQFEQVIKFIRNVLTHNISANIHIKEDDFIKQKIYLDKNKIKELDFDFKYAESFPKHWKGNVNYGLQIKVDFKTLAEGQKFFEIINLHQLFLLSELCFNLTEIYKI